MEVGTESSDVSGISLSTRQQQLDLTARAFNSTTLVARRLSRLDDLSETLRPRVQSDELLAGPVVPFGTRLTIPEREPDT